MDCGFRERNCINIKSLRNEQHHVLGKRHMPLAVRFISKLPAVPRSSTRPLKHQAVVFALAFGGNDLEASRPAASRARNNKFPLRHRGLEETIEKVSVFKRAFEVKFNILPASSSCRRPRSGAASSSNLVRLHAWRPPHFPHCWAAIGPGILSVSPIADRELTDQVSAFSQPTHPERGYPDCSTSPIVK